MQHHGTTTDFGISPAIAGLGVSALAGGWDSPSPGGDAHHARAALTAAVEDGLLSEEVDEILDGRSVLEVFPVQWRETPRAYASRAVAEMMVAYLA